MLMDHCAKAFKMVFRSVFRDCRWMKFHGHCVYITRATPLVSCHHRSSIVRHSHDSATSVSCQKLGHRSLVQVCGSDVLGFLQGLVTNDVRQLETDGSAIYAMMLSVQVGYLSGRPTSNIEELKDNQNITEVGLFCGIIRRVCFTQGRVLCDLILYRLKADEPTVLIECQHDVTSDLISSLLRYKLRKKITVADVGNDFSVWSAFCESIDMPDLHVTNKDAVLCVNDPRHASFGRRFLLPSYCEPTFSGCSVTSGDYHSWRCQAGVGEGTVDFPPGQSFPLEANLDFMNGDTFFIANLADSCISDLKSPFMLRCCWLSDRKGICPTQDVRPGALVINASGKECGKVRSVFGPRALGLLRIDDVVGKGKLEVRVEDSKVADAETYIPSWWPTASDAVVQHAVARNERASTKD